MRTILLFAIILSAIGCTSSSFTQPTAQYLTVLHTNDNHGRFWHNEKGEYGMAARKTLIDTLRVQAQKQGHAVLLLSGGDINTGIPESDLLDAEPDFKGMSLIGYDAMALGNHEFDNAMEVLKKQQQWANFPLLSANIFDKKTDENVFDGYKIFKKNTLTIAVIGLTTTDTAKIGNPQYVGHLKFKDPINVTAHLAQQIEARYQPDIVIALTHMGHFVDARYGINAPGDVTLARSLPSNTLDMIIGGHSQEPVCMAAPNQNDDKFRAGLTCMPDQQNGTWIMQAHEWGKYVGKAEFKLEQDKLTLMSYTLLPVNLYIDETQADGSTKAVLANEYITPNPELQAFLATYQAIGEQQIEGKVGYVNAKLDGDRKHVRFQQSTLARVIIQAQMNSVNADFGIISGGGIRDGIAPGDVSYKDILKVQPFSNEIAYIDFSGSELWQYLNTVTRFPPNSGAYMQYHKLSFKRNNGILTDVWINDKDIQLDKTYRMSINTYNATGGDGYPDITQHKAYVGTGILDAEAFRQFFIDNSPLDAMMFSPKM